MMRRTQTTHIYELTKDEVTEALIDFVVLRQKSRNKSGHPQQDGAVSLAVFSTREVTIIRDESPDRNIVGALVKFEP